MSEKSSFIGTAKKLLLRASILLAALLVVFIAFFYWRYGGTGQKFPDLSTTPLLPEASVEIVAKLDEPPGNLAVSKEGRVFFTYHAESRPEIKVLEL
ncbi:MAG: hypothetical protein JNN15_21110, partial [Blastocatellia bacterium]|nr:hypothetical protein [Blastocatellia bacterium]